MILSSGMVALWWIGMSGIRKSRRLGESTVTITVVVVAVADADTDTLRAPAAPIRQTRVRRPS